MVKEKNEIMKIGVSLVFILTLFSLIPLVNAIPGTWRGFVFIDGSAASSGAIVDAVVNNASTVTVTTTTPSVSTAASNYYLVNIETTSGNNVTFKVNGIPALADQTWSIGLHPNGSSDYFNLSVSKLANGQSCSYAAACSGGFCNSGTCASSAPSGGGGSTGGGASGGAGGEAGGAAETKVTTEKGKATVTIPSIAAEKSATVNINKTEDIAITQIAINVKNSVNNIQITVTKLDNKPASITQEVSGKVYHYIQIDKVNVTDADVNKTTIKFKVEKSWISNNGIDESKVALHRYAGNAWNKLTTAKTGDDSEYVYYESVSPGLSVFAVSGEVKVAPPAEQPPAEQPPSITPPIVAPGGIPFYIWIILAALIAAAVYFFTRRKS